MSSESVSTLVLFIAAMLVAAGVAGTLVTNVNDISGSIETQSGDVREKIDTDIEIISDPGSDAVYDGEGNVSILVKNTGDRTLSGDGSDLDVLINGEYRTNGEFSTELHGGDADSSAWRSGEVLEIRLDGADLDSGTEHRIAVLTNGDDETFEFYVPSTND